MTAFWKSACLASAFSLTAPLAMAQTGAVTLPATEPFPESISVAADGTLYASSITNGGISRALPGRGAAAEWIRPGSFGTRSTFGVLADAATGTLFVCSNDATGIGIKGPTAIEGAYLKTFDLASGKPKTSLRLPAGPAICNDFARAADGAMIVTNTAAPELLRLTPDGKRLDIWVKDDKLKGGMDGLAFDKQGDLYVDTYVSGELFRVSVTDGKPGAVTKLATSRPITHPDAMKAIEGGFLMVEGAGTLDRVTIDGDKANIETLAHFDGPTGIALHGDTVWVSEGKLALIADQAKAGATLPSFHLRSMKLPEVTR